METLSGNVSSSGTKSRRSHRKSRNGCHECKRRHIRCDESRPACTNCKIAERECSFPRQDPHSQLQVDQSSRSARTSPAASILRGSTEEPLGADRNMSRSPGDESRWTTSSNSWPITPPHISMPFGPDSMVMDGTSSAAAAAAASGSGMSFTPQHLMLLHHAETAVGGDLTGYGRIMPVVDVAIRHAIDCPYLVDQLLALSAMHLAQTNPEQAAAYLHQATELQMRALSSFNEDPSSMTSTGASFVPPVLRSSSSSSFAAAVLDDGSGSTSSLPRFLFTTALTLHVLAETMTYHRNDFAGFLERFAGCIDLHRGVRALLQPTWNMLQQSALSGQQHDPRRGGECDALFALIDEAPNRGSSLGPEAAEACRGAARSLQWAFDLARCLPDPDVPHVVTVFTVTVPGDFAEVLRGVVPGVTGPPPPEALVILAYYGVLLHRRRRYWVCGNSGAFLILAIARALGDRWSGPMRWPLRVLKEETD